MNKHLFYTFIAFILMTFIIASSAEAKRLGGGSSFGSKKSYSSPFKKSTQKKSPSQQKASATNQQRQQQLSKRSGLMGMLGGLALGGLLGALFFGGAFENINFFDFLMIGGIAFAIFWFMKRKALSPRRQTSPATPNDFSASQPMDHQKKNATFAENFGMNYSNDGSASNNPSSNSLDHNEQTHDNEMILPDWFDQEEFLSGARSAYTVLQEAWDNGNLEAIKLLSTESVFNEISQQFAQDPSHGGHTRIIQLNAELIDFNEQDSHSEASVLFDALLDEDENNTQGRASQVRELWHFVRANNSSELTWYLDGIQQLDS